MSDIEKASSGKKVNIGLEPGERVEVSPKHEIPCNEKWEIEFDGNKRDCFQLRRFINGRIEESYAPMSRDRAVIAVVAIMQSIQPPTRLLYLDKPVD